MRPYQVEPITEQLRQAIDLLSGNDPDIEEARLRVIDAYDAIVRARALVHDSPVVIQPTVGDQNMETESVPEVDELKSEPCGPETGLENEPGHDSQPAEEPEVPEKAADDTAMPKAPRVMKVDMSTDVSLPEQDAVSGEAIEQTLFSTPQKQNRLFSLYDDDFEILPKKSVSEVKTGTGDTEQEPEVAHPSMEPQRKILADVVAPRRETIADAIRPTVESPVTVPLQSLLDGISIADQFLIQKELFAGNRERLDRTLAELDRQTCIEDCILYIESNFAWPHNLPSTRIVMDVLQRKFGK